MTQKKNTAQKRRQLRALQAEKQEKLSYKKKVEELEKNIGQLKERISHLYK